MTTPEERPGPERLTRNWNELLQELRVVQTGVQILTGFLLTVPFASRWDALDQRQVVIYLVVLAGAVLTTALVTAPVAFHRMVFRRRRRYWLVEAANQAARAGLGLLALTSAGVLLLVFDVVVGTIAGVVACGVALVFFAVLWLATPLLASTSDETPERRDSADPEEGRDHGP